MFMLWQLDNPGSRLLNSEQNVLSAKTKRRLNVASIAGKNILGCSKQIGLGGLGFRVQRQGFGQGG